LLDEETIARNCAGIRQTLESILDFDHPTAKPVIVNNYDWFQNFGYLEFLRDVGKHFRMGTMLAKDSVRSRLQSPEGISYTEFSYQVLQAYDFLHLHDNYGVTMQIGGSDQWGNITAGTEIVRKLRGTSVHGLTLPLLLKADGSKFGKTADGALWLRKDKVSPYDFYQYLVRSADEDVGKFLRMLTFLPVEKIEALEESMSQPDCVPNQVQKVLAQEVTRIVHGQAAVDEAERVTAQAAPGRSDTELDRATLEALSQSLPSVQLEAARFQGMGLLDLMLEAGLVQSKGDARRLIRNGGCYINNQSIQDERLQLGSEQLIDGELMLVAAGKKRKAVVRVS
jgi:tyrosyl-tRNA synthetase